MRMNERDYKVNGIKIKKTRTSETYAVIKDKNNYFLSHSLRQPEDLVEQAEVNGSESMDESLI